MAFVGTPVYEAMNEYGIIPTDAKIQRGCKVAGAVLRAAAQDPEEQRYLNGVITPALLGSAWHDAFITDTSDLPNDLMYRVIELPRLDIKDERPELAAKTWHAGVLHVEAAGEHRPFSYARTRIDGRVVSISRTRRPFRSLGLASLWLGAVDVARDAEAGRAGGGEQIQTRVRESGYGMTRQALQLARKIGALPTITQLPDPYSPLTVELMRSGPSRLRGVYQEAVEPTPHAA